MNIFAIYFICMLVCVCIYVDISFSHSSHMQIGWSTLPLLFLVFCVVIALVVVVAGVVLARVVVAVAVAASAPDNNYNKEPVQL